MAYILAKDSRGTILDDDPVRSDPPRYYFTHNPEELVVYSSGETKLPEVIVEAIILQNHNQGYGGNVRTITEEIKN